MCGSKGVRGGGDHGLIVTDLGEGLKPDSMHQMLEFALRVGHREGVRQRQFGDQTLFGFDSAIVIELLLRIDGGEERVPGLLPLLLTDASSSAPPAAALLRRLQAGLAEQHRREPSRSSPAC